VSHRGESKFFLNISSIRFKFNLFYYFIGGSRVSRPTRGLGLKESLTQNPPHGPGNL
jgi:hypothetical protein